MSKQYKLAVFIGRFAPFHNGHQKIVEKGLEVAEEVVLLVGSAKRPRSARNPFTFEERASMIQCVYPYNGEKPVHIEPIEDILYNDSLWLAQIQNVIKNYESDDSKITLIGHKKDATSYYIDMFPQWGSVPVEPFMNRGHSTHELSATYLRGALFTSETSHPGRQNKFEYCAKVNMDQRVIKLAQEFDISVATEEFNHSANYKKQFESLPYPPIFQTVDAVVIQSGHVLVVERGAMPGEGLLALPGGFLDADERIADAVIRELREETKIKVPEKVLIGNMKNPTVFDEPKRSSRGRTITTTYLIELPNGPLPKVKGSDDAAKAFWKPISDLKSEDFFEDHYDIIQVMIGQRSKLN